MNNIVKIEAIKMLIIGRNDAILILFDIFEYLSKSQV